MTRLVLCAGALVLCIPLGVLYQTPRAGADPTPEALEFFEKKVRPLLAENCYRCHGPKQQKGKLTLDSRGGLLRGGENGPAIVPGHPDKSLLVQAISYKNPKLRMPPRSRLSAEQIETLTAWIKMGAPWPNSPGVKQPVKKAQEFDLKERSKHWSFQPIKAQPLPAVKRKDWVQSPIDAFILARLEAAGLSPAAPADKRTLLRRVTFDLIGLPPTPAEIDAFLADKSPEAFARVVDRLLASPHHGERWGRHWLDLVRYAETYGHEFDFDIPEAYRYRDYVIRAFNLDLPYDRFVTEHVAGDLLPKPRRHPTEGYNESILGTGFFHLGEAKHSPVDVRGDQADRLDNQIDVFAKTFLGLTVACARCHDHKFDPITTKDYYALAGYLESSRFQRAFIDNPEPLRQKIEQLRAVQAQARALAVASTAEAFRRQLEKTQEWLRRAAAGPSGRAEPLLQPWLALADPRNPLTTAQFAAKRQELLRQLQMQIPAPHQPEAPARGTLFPRLRFGLVSRDPIEVLSARPKYVLFEDFSKDNYQDWFVSGEAFGNGPSQAGDVILQPNKDRPIRTLLRPGIAHSGLTANRLQGALRSKTFLLDRKRIWYHVAGRGAQVNLIIDGYQLIRDPIYCGLTFAINSGDRFVWHGQDVSMWQGHRAYIEILDDGPGYAALDRIVFSDEGPPPGLPNRLLMHLLDDANLKTPSDLASKYQALFREVVEQWRSGALAKTSDVEDRIALLNWLLQGELPPTSKSQAQDLAPLLELCKELEAALPTPRRGLALEDGTTVSECVFIRGNHKTLGEAVPPRFLEVLTGDHQTPPAKGSGRLELARRMLAPSDPLLPRVLVNRLWKHHFGQGIVATPDDFGHLGQPPTHPELLDFLAAEFVEQGWSIKKMHRLMLLSSTYQMASRAEPKTEEADPQNKLLHRMPIRRLEAEAIRDAMLRVSGRLDLKMYGPGVMPYLTDHMLGRGRPATSGPLDGAGRRSLYLAVRRNFLTPTFLAFDYPTPFSTMGKRTVSNVPAQALTMMNNPFVLQQAETWAKRVLVEPGLNPKQRLAKMYLTAFARPPSESEVTDALEFVQEQGKVYGRADDPRVWQDLCHVLMNVKEFIFVN
jgi:hypothetical protein